MIAKTALPALALLSGGLAKRLRPISEQIPKSMMEVAGAPFIAHQLRLCARQGLKDVVVCAGFLGEQIEAYVGSGRQFGVSVRYSIDWPVLLGTGGAIKKAIPLLGNEFFVMYGDSYLDIEFAPVYEAFVHTAKPGLMAVFHNRNQWDASNVEFADGEIRRYDKVNRTPDMQYIDYGLGLFRASAFERWAEGTSFDLADVFQTLLREGQLAGYVAPHRFYEIGTTEGLAETAEMLRSRT